MSFEIIRNDIVNMRTDAIVNTANPKPIIGSGTDAAIHLQAGTELLKARQAIGEIAPGCAAITPGFRLHAKFVIHTVGPVWQGGCCGEVDVLKRCYTKSLLLAKENHCRSIAFPLISAGNYGFPPALALQIASDACREFLDENEMQIYLVVFSRDAYRLSEQLYADVASYIDENYVETKTRKEYSLFERRREVGRRPAARRNESACFDDMPEAESVCCNAAPMMAAPTSLESMLKDADVGFSETLLRLIDRTGKKDSEIYKKANVDRKLFSKIRNNPGYQPSKSTVLAFAIALELNLEETKDLLSRAGFALSRSSKSDIIVEYFITHKLYDIHAVNLMLFQYDLSVLGC